MGRYIRDYSVPISQSYGRPVYKKADQYMFYLQAAQQWIIGPHVNDARGGLRNPSGVHCPVGLTGWEVLTGRVWTSEYRVTVKGEVTISAQDLTRLFSDSADEEPQRRRNRRTWVTAW